MNHRQAIPKETLNYRLRPNAQGIRLDIWEKRPTGSSEQASYRFFVTYQLESADDAQVILDSYLIANDVSVVPSNDAITPLHLRTLAGPGA